MGVVEWVLTGVVMLIVFKLRNVYANYRVVGNLIDLIGAPDLQEQLFKQTSNLEKLNRTARQYLFLTRYVPVLVIGVFMVIAVMFAALASGIGLSPVLSGGGALIIAGVVTWLLTFESVPPWLYDWHIDVLLTRGAIDLEAVHESLLAIEQRMSTNEFDELTDVEQEFVVLQVSMMKDVERNIKAMLKDLEQQRSALQAEYGEQ